MYLFSIRKCWSLPIPRTRQLCLDFGCWMRFLRLWILPISFLHLGKWTPLVARLDQAGWHLGSRQPLRCLRMEPTSLCCAILSIHYRRICEEISDRGCLLLETNLIPFCCCLQACSALSSCFPPCGLSEACGKADRLTRRNGSDQTWKIENWDFWCGRPGRQLI